MSDSPLKVSASSAHGVAAAPAARAAEGEHPRRGNDRRRSPTRSPRTATRRPLRAALIDGEGPHFSFGASVEEHLPAQCAVMLRGLHGLLVAMLEWPRPILVAVRGQCLGGGLELALAGSLIFASRDAQLGQPEIKLGVFAPAASCLLPFRVNRRRPRISSSPAAR